MNRADRRRQAKQQKPIKRPSYHGLTIEQKKEQLFKNGITANDLDKEYQAGYEAGRSAAMNFIIPLCYAAAALALRNLYIGKSRFGRERIKRFLAGLDEQVCDHLTSQEAIDEVWDSIGIKMEFNGAFGAEIEDKQKGA